MPSLVLLRHGESIWNARDVFTGQVDVDLTPHGEDQARRCGLLLRDLGLIPHRLHTSTLKRAIRTGALAVAAAGRPHIPARQDPRLDERSYGALEGLPRREVLARHGAEQYQRWRRSWDAAPPPDRTGDVARPGESLADVSARLLPCWNDVLAPDLRAGLTVLVTAHSNSLRALIALLDRVGPEHVPSLEVPIAEPLHYLLDDGLRPLVPGGRYVGRHSARYTRACRAARKRDRPVSDGLAACEGHLRCGSDDAGTDRGSDRREFPDGQG